MYEMQSIMSFKNIEFLEDFFLLNSSDLAEVGQWGRKKRGAMCCDELNCVQFTFNWMITRLFMKRNAFRDTGLNPPSVTSCIYLSAPHVTARRAICFAEICEAAPSLWWKNQRRPLRFHPTTDTCARRLFTSVFHPVMGLEDILTL